MKQAEEIKIDDSKIPDYVTHVTKRLEGAGFEAFLVGGCVRDLIMGRTPKDWDITTNAKPDEIISLFEKTIYENNFGTVAICINKDIDKVTRETIQENKPNVTPETNCSQKRLVFGSETKSNEENEVTRETEYHIVEVTPYRTETKYSDFRHPDEVIFSDNIDDDLKRRDFTMNAMSYSISKGHIKDTYKGHKDIKDMSIRTVGVPEERFNEDALRMLRAVRFSCQLGFTISKETAEAIFSKSSLLKNISA